MKNILYLLEMGCNDPEINTDVKNHRVRVVERVDIIYKGKPYNMFFEFLHGKHWHYRTENKRTGEPLKKPVYVVDLENGMHLDTQYEELAGTWSDGAPYYNSYRKSDLEHEFYNEHLEFTRKNILKVINRYKIGEKFTDVCLIEETAADIIRKIGGWRELDILGKASKYNYGECYFQIGETWTAEHKIVRVVKNRHDDSGKWITGDFCEVDLVTGKITG